MALKSAWEEASIYGDHIGMAEFLKSREVDINWRTSCYQATALIIACNQLYVPVVDLLLRDPRTDLNARDMYGQTGLQHLCSTHHPDYNQDWEDIMKKIILSDKPLDQKVNRESLLHWAVYEGKKEVIEWLIISGRPLDFRDYRDEDPWNGLDVMRSSEKYPEINRLLRDYLADPSGVRSQLRIAEPSLLFAEVLFVSEDLLCVKFSECQEGRFFSMANQLPQELQMLLCHRVYQSAKQNIPSKNVEEALRRLVKEIS